MSNELLRRIDEIVWDKSIPNDEKVLCIQNMLYAHEQMADAKSEALYQAYHENMNGAWPWSS